MASLKEFRCQIHASLAARADALFELGDALLDSRRIRSVAELSLSRAFRRRYHSVYDALREGRLDDPKLRELMATAEPAEAVCVGGYAVYVIDATAQPRPDADTLRDRGWQRSSGDEKSVPGYQYSFVGRVIGKGESWIAPRDVERVPTARTAGQVGVDQVRRLDQSAPAGRKQVVVGDGNYCCRTFLTGFIGLKQTIPVVRVRRDQRLYREPPPRKPTDRGAHRKHGERVSVRSMPTADEVVELQRTDEKGNAYTVRLSAWKKLHFELVAGLPGMVVKVEVFREDGSPRYKDPLWLFWGSTEPVALEVALDAYLLRFTVEHFFRFLKQDLGFGAAHGTDEVGQNNWVWVVAMTYCQLLLARTLVERHAHPWDRRAQRNPGKPLTPGLTLANWAGLRACLGTPAAPPRPAGKGLGRPMGFHPEPRTRYKVVSKGRSRKKTGKP